MNKDLEEEKAVIWPNKMQDPNRVLKTLEVLLRDELCGFKEIMHNYTQTASLTLTRVCNHLLLNRGKQIRPILMLYIAKSLHQVSHVDLLLAAVVEFIHNATLFHDDVLDDSLMRRGQDSAKNLWGNKISILAGDFLFTKALNVLSHTKNVEAICFVSDYCEKLVEGEFNQLSNLKKIDISMQDYWQIVEEKTSSLFSLCTALPGIVSMQSSKTIQGLKDLGKFIGLIFQLVDDIRDYWVIFDKYLGDSNRYFSMRPEDDIENFSLKAAWSSSAIHGYSSKNFRRHSFFTDRVWAGESKILIKNTSFDKYENILPKYGKDAGKDFLEGKVTLPLILLFGRGSMDVKHRIRTWLNQENRSLDNLLECLNLMDRYSIFKTTNHYLTDLVQFSIQILKTLNLGQPTTDTLEELLYEIADWKV